MSRMEKTFIIRLCQRDHIFKFLLHGEIFGLYWNFLFFNSHENMRNHQEDPFPQIRNAIFLNSLSLLLK